MTLYGRSQTPVAGADGHGYDPSIIHNAIHSMTETSLVEDVRDVLRRVAVGDAASFETLYRLAAPALLGFLVRKMGSREFGEECGFRLKPPCAAPQSGRLP
jgi:hypothetical protein